MRRAVLALLLTACGAGRAPLPTADLVNVGPVRGPGVGIGSVGGAGPATPSEPPVQLAAHAGQLCARADGRVYCVTSLARASQPVIQARNAIAGIEDAASLALGNGFGCVATRRGTVQCFGGNTWGELGAKLRVERSDVAVDVLGVAHARRVFAGASHACASLEDGTLFCWGRNESGQTGSDTYYTPEASELVSATVVPGMKSAELALSMSGTCAKLAAGTVSCWGSLEGRLRSRGNQRPTLVEDLSGVDEIAASDTSLCAVRGGEIVCWSGGSTLIPAADLRDEPLGVIPGLHGVKHLALSNGHGCALLADGRVSCFGMAYGGGLGRRNVERERSEAEPAAIVEGLPRAVAIVASDGITCALTRDTEAYCWGIRYTAEGAEEDLLPVLVRLR